MPQTDYWYCIYLATPLNEEPLKRSLSQSKVDAEFWFPKYKTKKQLKKKTKPIMRPVFATYAFLKCQYSPEIAKAVEDVTGCYFVPSASDNIYPIPTYQMDTLRTAINDYTSTNPLPPSLWNNRQVEIISGAFAGYSATVQAVVKDTIIAQINLFGREVPITLKKSELSAM